MHCRGNYESDVTVQVMYNTKALQGASPAKGSAEQCQRSAIDLFAASLQTDSAGGARNAVPYSIPGSVCASQPDNRWALNRVTARLTFLLQKLRICWV